MEPLDLFSAHPRKARAALAGVTFLPRSIDKFRAALPGGNLAGYSLEGFAGRMLENLGIAPDGLANVWAAIQMVLIFKMYPWGGNTGNGSAACFTRPLPASQWA
ncbi:MAG: hypothetical protein QOD51_2753 [Candidatus Eremiobacteraeota bacterium]|jgi:hypothetical protein|nr:hypothetical protein [Candidatus Eremiobacteraeota bacterium]